MMPETAVAAIRRSTRRRRVRRRLLRGTIRTAALAAAGTLMVLLVAIAARQLHARWRTGRVELTNDGPPLSVEVLDETGEHPIGAPIDLVKETTLALPDGDYRLRVNAVGRLGQTFRFAVHRGETIAHALALEEGRLLGGEPGPAFGAQERPREVPIPFAALTVAIELTPGKADLVECGAEGIVRRDGATGRPLWDTSRPTVPYGPGHDPTRWLRGVLARLTEVGFVEPSPDLDGDGTRDLILTLSGSPAFLALSGKDGSLLWNHVAELDGPGGPQPEGPSLPGPMRPVSRPGFLVGAPTLSDIDCDGTPDLVALLVFHEFPAEAAARTQRGSPGGARNARGPYQRRVVAVSGRWGRSLWAYPLDPTWTSRNSSYPTAVHAPGLVRGRPSSSVAMLDETRWVALDPSTGRSAAPPLDLGFLPVRPVQYADLDGDGEPEILALGASQNGTNYQSLVGFSRKNNRIIWVRTVRASYTPRQGGAPPPDWPWLIDPEGDGRSEIVVPYNSPARPQENSFHGVELIDGATGQSRWIRPIQPSTKADDGLVHLAEAADLDGDGTHDVVALSEFEGRNPGAPAGPDGSEPRRVYVDALSGRDGRPLWSWHADIARERFARIWVPRWWGLGPDGWPLLGVTLGGRHPRGFEVNSHSSHLHPPVTHVLEASTGREVHRLVGLTRTGVADLDGDGLTDLWGEAEGQLYAFRGETPERWRALGSFHPAGENAQGTGYSDRPVADLDGDGIGDALAGALVTPDVPGRTTGSRTAVARSGRDGHLLWKSVLDPPRVWFERDHGDSFSLIALPMPDGDLDGDGTPDVVAQKYVPQPDREEIRRAAALPLQVLSGRDGRRLWSAGPLPMGFRAYGYSSILWLEPCRVEPGSAPDVLVRHASPFLKPSPTPPPGNAPAQSRLARFSGRDGRVLWDVPLSAPGQETQFARSTPPRFADLDGDGSLDVAVMVKNPGAPGPDYEVVAVSLRDGRRIWSRPVEDRSNTFATGGPQLAIVDLEGDRRPEVLVTERPAAGASVAFEVQAFDGGDGKTRWTWRHAETATTFQVPGWLSPTDRGGRGTDSVYLSYSDRRGETWVVALGARGRERARRKLPQSGLLAYPKPVDLDGDGSVELLLGYEGHLRAWRADLTDYWSWPNPHGSSESVLRASAGRPATVLLYPAIGLDGATGRPRWAGLAPRHGWWTNYYPWLLDPGDPVRLPLILSGGAGATACRTALPTTPAGRFQPSPGQRVPTGLAMDDPRWTRPLPWTEPVSRAVEPAALLAVIGLAVINLVLPIAILWLAARRRPWTLRLLMTLPVAAAIPMSAFVTVKPLIPAHPDPLPPDAVLLFTLGTMAGIPILAYATVVGWSLARRRWRIMGMVAGLTLVAAAIIAAVWIRLDRQAMPAMEHYGRSNWYLVGLPGAYAVGILIPIAWEVKRVYRWLRRPRRPATMTAATTPLP